MSQNPDGHGTTIKSWTGDQRAKEWGQRGNDSLAGAGGEPVPSNPFQIGVVAQERLTPPRNASTRSNTYSKQYSNSAIP